MRETPGKASVVAACVLIASLMGILLFRNAIFGLLGGFLVAASVKEFLFPIRFELSATGARSRCLWSVSEIEWKNVRRIYVDAAGVKLSPLSSLSRLEAFRGVYLRFDGNREEALAAIDRWRKPDVAVGSAADGRAEAATH